MFKKLTIFRFILIILTIIVMQTKYCHAGCASDDMHVPPLQMDQKLPDEITEKVEAPKEANKVIQQDQVVPKPQMPQKPKAVLPQKPKTVHVPKMHFKETFFNMLGVLMKVLLLIGLIYGGILLYRKLKEFQMQKAEAVKVAAGEPQTVSEAVSSYVKHKLK